MIPHSAKDLGWLFLAAATVAAGWVTGATLVQILWNHLR